jgi:hypothetical protein
MTGAGEVFVTPQASIAQQNTYRRVDHTVTTANIDLTVNAWNYCTIAGLTADRDALLPATFEAGDWVGVHIIDGDATYELLLKGNTGDDINGGSAGAEWSRLMIQGERVLFRATVANTSWVVEDDGRIAASAKMEKTSSQSVSENSTTKINITNVISDPHSMCDTSNYRIILRRATLGVQFDAQMGFLLMGDQSRLNGVVYRNGAAEGRLATSYVSFPSSGAANILGSQRLPAGAAGDYFELYGYHSNSGGAKDTATSVNAPFLMIAEILR